MKPTFPLIILSSVALVSCGKSPKTEAAHPNGTNSTAAAHQANISSDVSIASSPKSNIDAYDLIKAIVRNPKILEGKWSEMSPLFPGCVLPANERDLTCPPQSGVKQISVQAEGAGVITIELTAPANCEEVRDIVQEAFGAGKQGNNKCDLDWDLSRWVKGGSAALFTGHNDATRIFFQMGLEQGP